VPVILRRCHWFIGINPAHRSTVAEKNLARRCLDL
jgi:hypothetical protein